MSTSIEQLRRGMRTLVEAAVAKSATSPGHADTAKNIEQICFDEYKPLNGVNRKDYVIICGQICAALQKPYGEYHEDTLAGFVVGGKIPVSDLLKEAVIQFHQSEDPRRTIKALLYKSLVPHLDPGLAKDYVTRIERTCFNLVIKRCSQSEDAYTRQWDAPMFVSLYSARCGIINSNLDPNGLTVKVHGSWALEQLISGNWTPEDVGVMGASELCPQASIKERDEITLRSQQTVQEKTSTLYKCPRCHKRNHTWREVQIGSGDEPSSFMCTCKECGQEFQGG